LDAQERKAGVEAASCNVEDGEIQEYTHKYGRTFVTIDPVEPECIRPARRVNFHAEVGQFKNSDPDESVRYIALQSLLPAHPIPP